MKNKQGFRTVRDLVELRRAGIARANREYQRGAAWQPLQQQKLVDSVLCGYPLPIIYLHFVKSSAGGMSWEALDIIDGQQRIDALYHYVEGAFPLLDPGDRRTRFPRFLQDQPCPWAGKDFHALGDGLQEQLLRAKVPVVRIEDADENEVRDLFVRLQSGTPLNPQERRDSLPGQFTEFVLSLGGKPIIGRYPGHPFFRRVLRMKPHSDRGRTRQLAAQIAILFEQHRQGRGELGNIRADDIDDHYYKNLEFDRHSPTCLRLRAILDKLDELLGGRKIGKLRKHDAIHLVLLLDSIWDGYTRSWESTLAEAHGRFVAELAKARRLMNRGKVTEMWESYWVWIQADSNVGANIQRRHSFYTRRMHEHPGNLEAKDPER